MSEEIDRSTIPEVVLVVAGHLNLDPGKLLGQAFQACYRAYRYADDRSYDLDGARRCTWEGWFQAGTRTIVKVTKNEAIFWRIRAELPGTVMQDEGFTDVLPGTVTMYVCGPFLHKDRPKLLDNKKLRLL